MEARKQIKLVDSDAGKFLRNIEDGVEEWGWADNEANKGKLQKAYSMFRKRSTLFGRRLLDESDVSKLKKSLPLKSALEEARWFTERTKDYEEFKSVVDDILCRHQATLKTAAKK